MTRGVVPISPRQIDPLSWITGPLVPLAFAAISTVYAVRGIVIDWAVSTPPFQVASAAMFAIALVRLHLSSRGLRGTISLRSAIGAVALGDLALLVSALGYADSRFAVELWWAPMSLALVFGALGPYFGATRIALIGGVATLAVLPPATALLAPGMRVWGPASVAAIIALPLVAGVVLTSLFSAYVVERMRVLLEARSRSLIVSDAGRDERAEDGERARLAMMTSRAVPFLRTIADTGAIGTADRWLAGQLARRLRDDLVTQASGSWLDRIDGRSRLVVIDPDRRAESLRPSQRSALRGLIGALLAAPGVDAESLLVELRGRPDGATAVGVSMDAELPEGRRIMHLAPYVLTLEMTADDLSWENDEFLQVTFEFPRESKTVPVREGRGTAAGRRRTGFREADAATRLTGRPRSRPNRSGHGSEPR